MLVLVMVARCMVRVTVMVARPEDQNIMVMRWCGYDDMMKKI